MLCKTINSKLAATFAAGLVMLVATGAQAKDSDVHSKRHHHHHKPTVTGPVHGPGSSHNPIITPTGTTIVRDHRPSAGDPDVRDHRGTPTGVPGANGGANRGGKAPPKGDPDVRDHRDNGFKP